MENCWAMWNFDELWQFQSVVLACGDGRVRRADLTFLDPFCVEKWKRQERGHSCEVPRFLPGSESFPPWECSCGAVLRPGVVTLELRLMSQSEPNMSHSHFAPSQKIQELSTKNMFGLLWVYRCCKKKVPLENQLATVPQTEN